MIEKKPSVLWFVPGVLFIIAGIILMIYLLEYKDRVEFSSSGSKIYNLSKGKYTIYGSPNNDKTHGIQAKIVSKSKNEEFELVESAEKSRPKKPADPLLDFQINDPGEYELQVDLEDELVSKPYVFYVMKLNSAKVRITISAIIMGIGLIIIIGTHVNRSLHNSFNKNSFFRPFYFKE